MAATVWSPAGVQAARSVDGVGAATDTFGDGVADGASLDKVSGFAVYVECEAAQTIATVISLKARVQNPYTLRWQDAPDWNIPNASGVTGVPGQYMAGFPVQSPAGRVGFERTAGTVSGGTLTIRIVCTNLAGELV